MPRVLPFPGLRFAPEVVGSLASAVCPPYDVISPAHQARLEVANRYNAVHLELPRDELGEEGSRYPRAARTLAEWRKDGALRADPRPAYYLHETRFSAGGRAQVRRDLLAAVGLEPWSTGQIRPHERTFAGPKADRLALLRATHANVSPVWVLYREQPQALADAWTRVQGLAPTASMNLEGEEHHLWRVDEPGTVQAIREAFAGGGPLYIADGHHRYETALGFANEAGADLPSAGAALAVVTWAADPGLAVFPTYRILPSAAMPLDALKTRWSEYFALEALPLQGRGRADLLAEIEERGRRAPTFAVLGAEPGQFLILQLKGAVPDTAFPAEHSGAWRSLDVVLLHVLAIDPFVPGEHRPGVEALIYTREPDEAFDAVEKGDAQLSFFLNATPVEQVLAVADANDRMPEKSTYFFPKTPTGLVIRDLAANDGI